MGQTPVRQGIAVTALLGVFVAVAIIFTGGSSLFTTPPPSSRATVSAADAVSPAHRTAERIAGDKLASARTADTLGLLHWLSIGYARRDLGKGDDAGPGFAALAGRSYANAQSDTPFAIRAPASGGAPDITLAAAVQPYAVSDGPPPKASYSEDPVPPAAPTVHAAGPERDQAAANAADFERFTSAAGAGDLNAEYGLGVMYRDGTGVARDPAAAARWLLASAQGGSPLAQLAIGEMYERGTGVARDPGAAYMWLDLAASRSADASDRSLAATERDRVAAALSEAELGAARRLVSDRLLAAGDQKAAAAGNQS